MVNITKIDRIKEIESRILTNKKKLYELEMKLLRGSQPQGYRTNCSYNDYDTIRGSREELHLDSYCDIVNKINTQIVQDQEELYKLYKKVDVNKYLNTLDNTYHKVKFLREIKGLTQKEAAAILGKSVRSIQRYERVV